MRCLALSWLLLSSGQRSSEFNVFTSPSSEPLTTISQYRLFQAVGLVLLREDLLEQIYEAVLAQKMLYGSFRWNHSLFSRWWTADPAAFLAPSAMPLGDGRGRKPREPRAYHSTLQAHSCFKRRGLFVPSSNLQVFRGRGAGLPTSKHDH